MIGWGAPNKQGTAAMHGEAMGNEEIAATRLRLGLDFAAVRDTGRDSRAWDMREKGARAEQEWRATLRGLQGGISRAGRRARAAHGRRPARRVSTSS